MSNLSKHTEIEVSIFEMRLFQKLLAGSRVGEMSIDDRRLSAAAVASVFIQTSQPSLLLEVKSRHPQQELETISFSTKLNSQTISFRTQFMRKTLNQSRLIFFTGFKIVSANVMGVETCLPRCEIDLWKSVFERTAQRQRGPVNCTEPLEVPAEPWLWL